MRVVIQHLVLGGGEGDPTGREGGAMKGPVAPVEVPPGACARLARALIPLSPVEGNRPPRVSSARSTQEQDVHPGQDRESPDHLRCARTSGPR